MNTDVLLKSFRMTEQIHLRIDLRCPSGRTFRNLLVHPLYEVKELFFSFP